MSLDEHILDQLISPAALHFGSRRAKALVVAIDPLASIGWLGPTTKDDFFGLRITAGIELVFRRE
jgi:hypothetical protein